jgi:hypothetical protein
MQFTSYNTPLEPGNFYHIYNRGNNYQDTFLAPEDYPVFLNKWREFIHPVAKTFAYNLLPNHFHMLVQIREEATHVDLPSPEGRLAKSVTGEEEDRQYPVKKKHLRSQIQEAESQKLLRTSSSPMHVRRKTSTVFMAQFSTHPSSGS